jgi:hypothetical protein
MSRFRLNQAELEELLNSPAGPVGKLLAELADKGAVIARGAVRVRSVPGTRRTRAGRGSSARPPGFTKASIHSHGPVRGQLGLYASVNAQADPAVFLETPAQQLTRSYPFLTTALDALEGQL